MTDRPPLKNPHYLPASNGWDRINGPGRLTSGRHLISPVIVWLFAAYGAVEFGLNILIPLIQLVVPR